MVALILNVILHNILWKWERRRYIDSTLGIILPADNRLVQTSAGNTLALQVDGEGNVRYDAIAHQGHRDGRNVQSQFKDLVPLAHRSDLDESARAMERPSEEEVQETAERTRQALEKLVHGKIKAAQPKNVPDSQGKINYIRYTPAQQGSTENGLKQRIIKMSEVVEDPLEPPRFKHKKIPRGPPSPPAPVLRSPPRKATAQEQKEWMIPPCISNWKNNKGFTIPLDKRLAADGRGLQDVCHLSRPSDPRLISVTYRFISMTTSLNSLKPFSSLIDTLARRSDNDLLCNKSSPRRRKLRKRNTFELSLKGRARNEVVYFRQLLHRAKQPVLPKLL